MPAVLQDAQTRLRWRTLSDASSSLMPSPHPPPPPPPAPYRTSRSGPDHHHHYHHHHHHHLFTGGHGLDSARPIQPYVLPCRYRGFATEWADQQDKTRQDKTRQDKKFYFRKPQWEYMQENKKTSRHSYIYKYPSD